MKVLNVSLMLALTLLVSCGGSKGGGSSKSKNGGSDSNPVKAGKVTNYTSECLNLVDGVYTKYVLETTYHEKEDYFDVKLKSTFSDKAGCKNVVLETLSSGEGVTSEDEDTLYVNFTQETWTPKHEKFVDGFNYNNQCGLSWRKNQATSVVGTSCSENYGEFSISPMGTKGFYICQGDKTPESGACKILTLKK